MAIADPIPQPVRPRPDTLGDALRRQRLLPIGGLIVAALAVLAVLAPWVAPFDPYGTDPAISSLPPSLRHPFGTGTFGEDIFSRVIWGGRWDLVIAVGAVGAALLLGGGLGAVTAFVGGRFDEITMRFVDMLQAFPSFILALGIAGALGPSFQNVIIAIALVNVPVFARLMRSKMLALKRSPYAMAAVAAGNPPWRVLVVHLLPNALTPLFVQATLSSGYAILDAAGLSFIGLGVRVPTPEWGVMISLGVSRTISGQWWMSFFPGLAIVVAVFGFSLIGEGLRDLFDPRGH